MLLGPMQLAVRFFELIGKTTATPLFMTRFAVMTFAAAFAMLLIFRNFDTHGGCFRCAYGRYQWSDDNRAGRAATRDLLARRIPKGCWYPGCCQPRRP